MAIAFGLGARVAGLPFVFVAAFLGAGASVLVVYRLARTGAAMTNGSGDYAIAFSTAGTTSYSSAGTPNVIRRKFSTYPSELSG